MNETACKWQDFANRPLARVCTAVVALLPTGILVAADPPARQPPELAQIVVEAHKLVPDAVVTERVATAIEADRFLNVDHVSIEIRDGVVHLTGTLQDYWDLARLQRLIRRIGGVRRVVNEIDMNVPGVDTD